MFVPVLPFSLMSVAKLSDMPARVAPQDFAYQNASATFATWDPIVDYINTNYANVSVRYSTLDDYFQAVHAVT